jgi:hypothetical protein
MVTEGEPVRREGTTVLGTAGDVLPRRVLPLVAASVRLEVGEALPFSLLREEERRVVPGHTLRVEGAETIEVLCARYETRRCVAEEGGRTLETYWVDENRRVRKIEVPGGPVAVLSTREAAEGGAP